MDARIAQIVAQLRQQLAALYGDRLKRLVVYGSQARGDARPDSDIDVLVVLAGPVQPDEEITRSIDIVAGLSLDHDEVICCAFVSADDFERGGSPLLMNVRREGVLV